MDDSDTAARPDGQVNGCTMFRFARITSGRWACVCVCVCGERKPDDVAVRGCGRGSRGAAVQELQFLLVQAGMLIPEAIRFHAGMYGKNTESAVAALQLTAGMVPSGAYDDETAGALAARMARLATDGAGTVVAVEGCLNLLIPHAAVLSTTELLARLAIRHRPPAQSDPAKLAAALTELAAFAAPPPGWTGWAADGLRRLAGWAAAQVTMHGRLLACAANRSRSGVPGRDAACVGLSAGAGRGRPGGGAQASRGGQSRARLRRPGRRPDAGALAQANG